MTGGRRDPPDLPFEPAPDAMAADLAAEGRVLLLETVGRRSGRRRVTAVGFVEDLDGTLRVAAGDPAADWAQNLLADTACRISIAGEVRACRAEPLHGPAAGDAVVALILRYGTPAERLGRGPVFRLVPVAPVPA